MCNDIMKSFFKAEDILLSVYFLMVIMIITFFVVGIKIFFLKKIVLFLWHFLSQLLQHFDEAQ